MTSAIGLDISDHTIKVVALERTRSGGTVVKAKNRAVLPPGVVAHGRIQDAAILADSIRTLLQNADPSPIVEKRVVLALPETQVYTHAFRLRGQHENIDALLAGAIKKVIPLPPNDIAFSHAILEKTKDYADVLAVASSKEVVEEWRALMRAVALDLVALDVVPLALFRDLYAERPSGLVGILDIGSRQATLSIFGPMGLVYSHTSYIAGNRFTEAIAGAGAKDAKEEKKTYGLNQPSDAARAALEQEVDALFQEVKKAIHFFEERRGGSVTELVLAGGGSQLIGLLAAAAKHIDIPIRLGQSVLLNDPRYIGAAGMALRGIDRRWMKSDPTIPIHQKKIKKQAVKTGTLPAPRWEFAVLAAAALLGAGLLFFIFREQKKSRAEEHLRQQTEAQERINAIE